MQLQLYGKVVSLLPWFINERNAKLTRYSMLQNFPSYLNSFSENMIIAEMSKLQHHSSKGHLPYFSDMVCFTLLLCYTSEQAYSLLLKTLPLPSISLLCKLKKGTIDSLKAVKFLLILIKFQKT